MEDVLADGPGRLRLSKARTERCVSGRIHHGEAQGRRQYPFPRDPPARDRSTTSSLAKPEDRHEHGYGGRRNEHPSSTGTLKASPPCLIEVISIPTDDFQRADGDESAHPHAPYGRSLEIHGTLAGGRAGEAQFPDNAAIRPDNDGSKKGRKRDQALEHTESFRRRAFSRNNR